MYQPSLTESLKDRIHQQFMSPQNMSYIKGVVREKVSNIECIEYINSNINMFALRFLNSHGHSQLLNLVDSDLSMPMYQKFWMGVQTLNKHFIKLIVDYTQYDVDMSNTGKHDYINSMFIATNLRPQGYEFINDDATPGYYNHAIFSKDPSNSKETTYTPFDKSYDKYRSSVMSHMSQHYPHDLGEIYGNDYKISDRHPHFDGVDVAIAQSKERLRNIPIVTSNNAFDVTTPGITTIDTFDVTGGSNVKGVTGGGNKGVNSSDTARFIADNKTFLTPGGAIKLGSSTDCDNKGVDYTMTDDVLRMKIFQMGIDDNIYPEYLSEIYEKGNFRNAEEVDREGHISRRFGNKYTKDQVVPWFQNLSKRHMYRKGDNIYEEDDTLDHSITESSLANSRGNAHARGNYHLHSGEGDGFRYRTIYGGKFEDKPSFDPDPRTHWNRELGYRLYSRPSASVVNNNIMHKSRNPLSCMY